MHNYNSQCTGVLKYEAPVLVTADFSAVSVLCASGAQQDLSNTIDDLDSQDFGTF